MSRVLERFPKPPERRSTRQKYNWALWFDGRIHALSPDEYGDAYVFRNSAHTTGARKGFRVRTAFIGDELIIQAIVDPTRDIRERLPRAV